MSYLNQAHDPRRHATAIVTAGAVHALLAAGLIAGLAVDFDSIVDKPLIGTNIPLDPPKPEPTPTPSTPVEQVSFVPPALIPPIDLPQAPGPERAEVVESSVLSYIPEGSGDDVAPSLPPPPTFTPKRAVPRNSGSWIDNSNYPRRPLVEGIEGSVGYRLVIGTNGRVASCELTRPSGNRALDEATCRLITSRARFEPAADEAGAKVLGTYTGSVTWEIPD